MSSGSEPPRAVVHELDQRECWTYLQQQDVGRVAVAAAGDIGIYPVNYIADRGRIRFRTDPGTKLIELMLNGRVAFEVDVQNEDTAWSVLVRGTAEEVQLSPDKVAPARLPDTPWVPGPRKAIVDITPVTMTGRLFVRTRPPEN